MATSYKNSQVLGTVGLTTYATLYNTTESTTAVLSTIVICNRGSADKQFRIAVCSTQSTPSNEEFIAYYTTVAGEDTTFITIGATMESSQYLTVSSTDATLSFTAFVA